MLTNWVGHLSEQVTVYKELVDVSLALMAVNETLKRESLSLSQLREQIQSVLEASRLLGTVGKRMEVFVQLSCFEKDEVAAMWTHVRHVGAEVTMKEIELRNRELVSV